MSDMPGTSDGRTSPVPQGADRDPISISEDVEPSPGLIRLQGSHVPREETRRRLAYALVAILGILVAVGCAGWLLHGDDVDRMQNFALIFAPVVTLLGTILGFYFSNADQG